MNSSWATSLIVIRLSASSVIYTLREVSSNQPSLHLLYFSTYSGIKNSLLYPKHILRAHYISMCLATLFVSLFVNRATTNIYGRKYHRIQHEFSKSQGKFSTHFASHILGLSV